MASDLLKWKNPHRHWTVKKSKVLLWDDTLKIKNMLNNLVDMPNNL